MPGRRNGGSRDPAAVRRRTAGRLPQCKPEDYDRALCLLPRDVVDFVLATQPKEWRKLAQHHGKAAVHEQFLKRLAAEIERRGALDVLSTLRWDLKENRQDDKGVTHAVLKTIAAFLNTEGGDLLIGVANDRTDEVRSDADSHRGQKRPGARAPGGDGPRCPRGPASAHAPRLGDGIAIEVFLFKPVEQWAKPCGSGPDRPAGRGQAASQRRARRRAASMKAAASADRTSTWGHRSTSGALRQKTLR